jgi:hypothetical protein
LLEDLLEEERIRNFAIEDLPKQVPGRTYLTKR